MTRLFLAVAAAALIGCSAEDGDVHWFEEAADAAGLSFSHESGHVEGHFLMPEIMGGGAALLDADGDGRLDVYFVQSGSVQNPSDARNRLFLNVSDSSGLRFRDVSATSGADDGGYGMGATVGDYDGDGDCDLYVTNWGPDVLLRNEGDGTFRDVTIEAGLGHPGWSTSAAFLDYDGDGVLDLYVATYLDWTVDTELLCRNAADRVDYCNPAVYESPALDVLYRGEGGGRFRDASAESGVNARAGAGLGVLCADFDGDRLLDVFVANDGMPDFLWRNTGGGRFEEVALSAGCAVDEFGLPKAGMGVAAADLDGDGDLDLLVGNLNDQKDSLYRNDGGLFFDVTLKAGLGLVSRPFTRFGLGWIDFDCDGELDLYQANGRVNSAQEPHAADRYAEPNLLLAGRGAMRFGEILPRGGTCVPLVATSRAAAFGDLDDDGGVDVVVVNRDGPAHLLRNVHPDRSEWIGFRLVDERGADVLHARVTCEVNGRTIARETRAASSYLASNDPRVHIGLGDAARVEAVEVLWPSGTSERFGTRAAGRYHELRRGSGE